MISVPSTREDKEKSRGPGVEEFYRWIEPQADGPLQRDLMVLVGRDLDPGKPLEEQDRARAKSYGGTGRIAPDPLG